MGVKIKQLEEWEAREGAAGFTRASASTITVTNNADNQAIFQEGLPVRYRLGTSGAFSYGRIQDYTTGTVTISGVSLPATINNFQVGPITKLNEIVLFVPGTLTVANDQYKAISKTRTPWLAPKAFVVSCYSAPDTAASGANLIIEPVLLTSTTQRTLLNPTTVSLGTSTNFVDSGAVVNESNYEINYGDFFDFNITQVGSTTAGSDLTVIYVVVNE